MTIRKLFIAVTLSVMAGLMLADTCGDPLLVEEPSVPADAAQTLAIPF